MALAWTLFAAICRVAQAFESVYKALHKRPLLRRRSVLAVEVGRGGEEDEQLVLPASALPAPAMFSGGAAGTPSAAQRTTRRSTRAARATSALSGASTPLVASPPPPGLAQQQQQRTLGANLAVASKALSSATPSRRTRSVAAGSDAGSRASMLMDVDEAAQSQQPQQGKDTNRLLVKDESYAIAERKGLPVEVQEAIAASGASASPFSLLPRRADSLLHVLQQTRTRSPSRPSSTRSPASPSSSAPTAASCGTGRACVPSRSSSSPTVEP